MANTNGTKLKGASTGNVMRDGVLALAHLVFAQGADSVDKISLRSIRDSISASESTFFRHFHNRRELVSICYSECWREINDYLKDCIYLPATISVDPVDEIRSDLNFLTAIFFEGDDDLRAMATCAFYMYRRSDLLGLAAADHLAEQQFTDRLTRLCRLAGYFEPEHFARQLLLALVAHWIIWSMNIGDPVLCQPELFGKSLEDLLSSRPKSERGDAATIAPVAARGSRSAS